MAKNSEIKSVPVAEWAGKNIVLATLLSAPAKTTVGEFWIVGDTPLIVHAWSEKAKREMLAKQVKSVKAAKEARDPESDFQASLYRMGPEEYGFPATAIKLAICSMAHKDKGIARSDVMRSLFIDAIMVRVMPAMAGAVCDVPLVRIFGSEPEMREDMVRVGAGMQKTSSLAYRAQFTNWAIKLKARFNADVIPPASLIFLINEAGLSTGIGDWRAEKKGMMGSFHLGTEQEHAAWDAFAARKGTLPIGANYQLAAE